MKKGFVLTEIMKLTKDCEAEQLRLILEHEKLDDFINDKKYADLPRIRDEAAIDLAENELKKFLLDILYEVANVMSMVNIPIIGDNVIDEREYRKNLELAISKHWYEKYKK